jgi:protein TonB
LHASFIRLNTGGPDLSEDAIAPVLASSSTGTLSIALAVSLVFHAVLLLIHFKFPDANPFKDTSPTIEVVLVNSKSAKRPTKADALAQVGGLLTQLSITRTPDDSEQLFYLVKIDNARFSRMVVPGDQLDMEVVLKRRKTLRTMQPIRKTMPSSRPKGPMRTRLLTFPTTSWKWRAWRRRSRASGKPTSTAKAQFVGARTKGVVYAEYVDQWRQKIERVGTANFPDQARREGLFGNVLVTVAIKADGTVERVEIDRSSGSRVLDAAVERIVMLASPFKPFPANVRREADILHITRNWSFTRSDLLLQ